VSVVAAFEAILATADEEYRMGRRSDFGFQLPRIEPVRAVAALG
jgi:hypothetical protein